MFPEPGTWHYKTTASDLSDSGLHNREDDVQVLQYTAWQGDRWNMRFMQKLDRMFTDANAQGMYLFVNGLVDLLWDCGIP